MRRMRPWGFEKRYMRSRGSLNPEATVPCRYCRRFFTIEQFLCGIPCPARPAGRVCVFYIPASYGLKVESQYDTRAY